MIELKYSFFILFISALVIQYFRYKNTQNQTFLSHLDYFLDLSYQSKEQSTELKFLVGFEFIKFSIFKKIKINKEESSIRLCNYEIETFADVQCALSRSRKNSLNARYFVKNETLFKVLLKESSGRYAQRMSGSGINFARELAHINNTKILFAARMDKQSLGLLPNNVKVVSTSDEIKQIGLRKLGIIVSQLDNHRTIFDRAGAKTILEDFNLINKEVVKEFSPHCIVIGRFPLFKNEFNERMSDKIGELSKGLSLVPTLVVIHHQMGLLDSVPGGVALVRHLIPYLDSIDLGVRELHQLYSIVRMGHIDTVEYSSDIQTSLTILDDLWAILSSGSFSSKPGSRKISRIHFQAHDYHVLIVAPQAALFHMNLRHALAKGLMARLHSRCGRKLSTLREKIHFHLEDEFFVARNLSSSPIQCWSKLLSYDICVSPVPTCLDLSFPLGDGESAAAASLASQIRLVD